jgi:putative ABC transport system permease protein
MRWPARIAHRIGTLFRRHETGARLQEEMEFHLDRQIAENIAAGMTPADARFAALRAFGNPALLREHTRTTWGWNHLEALVRDLRYSMRTLVRTPGFTVIAILVMALGIGANVALFTVVRGVLLRPLPFKDASRLVMLYQGGLKSQDGEAYNYSVVAAGIYSEWKKHNHSFDAMSLMQEGEFALSGSGSQLPERVAGAEGSWDLFSTLGVRPALGRDFTAADDTRAANPTVILSWSLYKRRFGSDPGILNQTVNIDGRAYSVIGVMPPWFAFPESNTQLWTPAYNRKPDKVMAAYDKNMFRVVGRLKPGVTEPQARADLAVISRQIHEAHPDDAFIRRNANSRPLLEHFVGDLKRPLYLLLAATGFVLLIACLNVANLLVARAAARRRELAIRTALGGGWLRLLRERLIESLMLCVGGGGLGILFAITAIQWLLHTREDFVRAESVHIDALVVAFTLGTIFFCALLAGVISAFSSSDKQVLTALHESSRAQSGSRARAGLRRTLLTLEVGLTVVLLIGAGLLLKSYERMRSKTMGCVTQNVLTMAIRLPGARYNSPQKIADFYQSLLTQLCAVPGVTAAGFVEAVPGQGYWEDSGFTIVEHPPLAPGTGNYAINRWADPGYFASMGIPILRGRTFDATRRLDQANEVVISQAFAQKYFPSEDPIGKHLKTVGRTMEIVGIVGDTRYEIGKPPLSMKYFSLYSGENNGGTLVIRSNKDAETLALPVQRVIQNLDHDLPVSDVQTMQQLLGHSMVDQSFNTTLLVGFASVSLLLAAIGLFGVLSYMVAQRTGEIGIRMALGAPRAQVMRRMLLDGLRPAALGLALGLIVSVEASRLLQGMLYETQNVDPLVFAAVAAALLAVAMLACALPAWRASRIDPMQALRTE